MNVRHLIYLAMLLLVVGIPSPAAGDPTATHQAARGHIDAVQRPAFAVPRQSDSLVRRHPWVKPRAYLPRYSRHINRCWNCSVLYVPLDTHYASDPAPVLRPRQAEQPQRTFGPIIRRDSCVPKVYVRNPDTGRFDTYCGGSELVNSEPRSARH